MAQSPYYSPSPSPEIESSHVSDSSSDDDLLPMAHELAEISRPGSPLPGEGQLGQFPATEGDDTTTCQWEDCGKVFDHLPSLIDHIHNGTRSMYMDSRRYNYVVRSHWRTQIELHVRMENMPSSRHCSNISICPYFPHTFTYG